MAAQASASGSSPLRILVTGSRNWASRRAIIDALDFAMGDCPPGDVTVVHGACPTGADRIADEIARKWGAVVERHPADWDRHGRRAAFLRNKEMVDRGADVCLAFPQGESTGTRMTMKLAEAAGIPLVVRDAI